MPPLRGARVKCRCGKTETHWPYFPACRRCLFYLCFHISQCFVCAWDKWGYSSHFRFDVIFPLYFPSTMYRSSGRVMWLNLCVYSFPRWKILDVVYASRYYFFYNILFLCKCYELIESVIDRLLFANVNRVSINEKCIRKKCRNMFRCIWYT